MAIYSLPGQDVVRVSGPDARKLLNDTLTCRFDDGLQGAGRWFALLSPQGKIQVEGGPDMVFTYLQSNVFCGMQNCPVRLFEDNKLVQEFDVCTAPADEQVTSDGLQLISCGIIHDISRQAGTPASSSEVQ